MNLFKFVQESKSKKEYQLKIIAINYLLCKQYNEYKNYYKSQQLLDICHAQVIA